MDSQFLRQGNSSFGLLRKFMLRNNFYHNLKQLCTAYQEREVINESITLILQSEKIGSRKRAKLTGLKCQGQSLGQIYFGVFLILDPRYL